MPPAGELAELKAAVARLEAEAQEHRLRAELLNRAVGVPEPGAGAWAQLRSDTRLLWRGLCATRAPHLGAQSLLARLWGPG